MKYDLTNIKFILNSLGNPHYNFQSIHIAGTNGKGATASFIASILMEHGLKTGLFTSPHILRFNERIRINGKCISNKYIKDFLEENKTVTKKVKPSFFEVNTAIAFNYFADKKVDIAVIECGLGGRLDSTNVLKPKLSVITQIGMDHMQYLGNTLEKIALEKMGIVKRGIDTVVSDNNKTLSKIFKMKIRPEYLIYVDDEVKIKSLRSNLNGTRFKLNTPDLNLNNIDIPLPGEFQVRNASCAVVSAIKYLQDIGMIPDDNKIKKGLANVVSNTGYRCRLESIRLKGKEFIFDISHNADGLKKTYKTLKSAKIDAVIFGMMEDKDMIKAIKEILRISNNIIFTKANYKRAANPEFLNNIAEKYCSKKHTINVKPLVKSALNSILGGDKSYKRVLITGSFFIVSDAIKALKIQKLFK